MADRLAADKRNLAVKSERLWGLSPLKKISGGFGFITDGDGKRLETVEQAEAGKRITVRVKDDPSSPAPPGSTGRGGTWWSTG